MAAGNCGGRQTAVSIRLAGSTSILQSRWTPAWISGVLGTGIAFPTVPEGKARVRTIMTATHTKDELTQALEVLGRVGKRMGILG